MPLLLTQKMGPLPVWAWTGIGAAGVALVLYRMRGSGGGQPVATDAGSAVLAQQVPYFQPSPPDPGGGFGGVTIVTPTPPATGTGTGTTGGGDTPAGTPTTVTTPTTVAPASADVVTEDEVRRLQSESLAMQTSHGGIGSQEAISFVNDPANFALAYHYAFPQLSGDEIGYVADKIREAWRNGILQEIGPPGTHELDYPLVTRIVNLGLVDYFKNKQKAAQQVAVDTSQHSALPNELRRGLPATSAQTGTITFV